MCNKGITHLIIQNKHKHWNLVIPGLEGVKFYNNARRWISIESEQQTDPIAEFNNKIA